MRRREKQEIPVADFCPEESVRRQEKQDVPVADDRPVFFLAKWVGREASQGTFRDQFLSFFWTFSFLWPALFLNMYKLLEKISRTSIESLADCPPVLSKLAVRKRLNWNILFDVHIEVFDR